MALSEGHMYAMPQGSCISTHCFVATIAFAEGSQHSAAHCSASCSSQLCAVSRPALLPRTLQGPAAALQAAAAPDI